MLGTAKVLEDRLDKLRALESRLTFRLSVLSKRLDAQALLSDTGINLTSYRILNVINTFGAASISDISRFCGIDRAQVSRTAVDLEKQGLVTFGDDPVNQRKKIVSLGQPGLDLLDRLQPRFLARNDALDTRLGPERPRALMEALDILSDQVSN
jgi:DNA-binding MarR family transcriptional regulator